MEKGDKPKPNRKKKATKQKQKQKQTVNQNVNVKVSIHEKKKPAKVSKKNNDMLSKSALKPPPFTPTPQQVIVRNYGDPTQTIANYVKPAEIKHPIEVGAKPVEIKQETKNIKAEKIPNPRPERPGLTYRDWLATRKPEYDSFDRSPLTSALLKKFDPSVEMSAKGSQSSGSLSEISSQSSSNFKEIGSIPKLHLAEEIVESEFEDQPDVPLTITKSQQNRVYGDRKKGGVGGGSNPGDSYMNHYPHLAALYRENRQAYRRERDRLGSYNGREGRADFGILAHFPKPRVDDELNRLITQKATELPPANGWRNNPVGDFEHIEQQGIGGGGFLSEQAASYESESEEED